MKKVLVAEDFDDLLDFMLILLNRGGFNAVGVQTKTALFEQITNFKPDIIILDVVLANSDGRQMCKEIKQHHPHIKVLLVSARQKLLENYRDCGADAILEKPFAMNDLKKLVDELAQD